MKLHRFDYENRAGKMVKVMREEIYVWTPLNITTGEVPLDEVERFDDQLKPLAEGWEWRRFTLTLS